MMRVTGEERVKGQPGVGFPNTPRIGAVQTAGLAHATGPRPAGDVPKCCWQSVLL